MEQKIEEKLIELANSYTKKQEINFEWNQEDGLRYVSDESLELAYEILNKANISLENKEEDIIINNNIVNLCNLNYTTKELIDKIKDDKTLLKESTGTFKIKNKLTIDRVCYDCKFQKCPKHLTGYIFYLMNKNLLNEKLEDRKNFRQKNEVNDVYAFKWNYGKLLRIIPDDVYKFSYELAKKNLVYVEKYLTRDRKFIEMRSALTCSDYKVIFGDIQKLQNEKYFKKKYSDWACLRRKNDMEVDICDIHTCYMRGCPTIIAAIILYLINTGKENILEEERKYYKEHQEEATKELQLIIDENDKKREKSVKESLDILKDYKDKIDKFDDLILALTNRNQTNLHCIIEGDDIAGKNKFINNIVRFLYNNQKINDLDSIRMSLQNFAADNTYSFSDKRINNEKEFERDLNGVLCMTQQAIKYTMIKERKVYILTGISEFIKDYKQYKNTGFFEYSEIRRKQYEHAIDLLTEISYSNYIILEGTTKEIDDLLQIEPKLQYIYQNYRFKFPEISLDETFNIYSKELENDIFLKLKTNEQEYKNKFIKYISLNRNFIPFTNRELASYLAMYSNSKNDVIFPEDMYKKETVDEALKNIIGLNSVKEKVKEFENYMLFKVKAESQGIKLKSSNLHMIFTGDPGTGKTTIARIMAKMLFDMGIVKENKLIEVERKDLIAGYIGQTATKTSEVISKAMGGVLFIDEAYSLVPKDGGRDFGEEAIATLIKSMEDHKDELVVIFAGYKDEMKNFMDINPGITSRIGYTFDFPNYTVEELIQIFYKKIENMGFICSKDCNISLKKICKYFSKRKSFGNGRFIDKLIQEVILKHAINNNENIKEIIPEDIPSIKDFNNSNEPEETTEELLEKVIGLEDLKIKIKEFEDYVRFVKETEKNNINIPNQNMHMIFTGNPGSGKTTIARIMVKILFNAGIIQENKLVEVERKDLIAGYIGQTAPKTYEVVEKAMGGVLFIDEAYSLNPIENGGRDFGPEAIATLIKAMEDHKGEFIVIFAGYKKEMQTFVNMNPGISSRIGYTFDFPDYTREELAEILYRKLEKSNLTIQEEAKTKVFEIMNYFCRVENIGNGRFADKVFQEILLKHAKNKDKDITIIKENDIPSIKEMTECIINGKNMINPEEISEESLRKTATHEIGHALVRYKLYQTPGIIKITINPEGNGTLGYVRHKITEGEHVSKKSTLLNRIKVCLAGMAAEEVFIGEFANGNTSDLQHATLVAKNMVTRYGMSNLGLGQIEDANGPMAEKVQEEINSILAECYKHTIQIIEENKTDMSKVIEYLLKEKEIDEEEFLKILNK